jgi:hypothetical protein
VKRAVLCALVLLAGCAARQTHSEPRSYPVERREPTPEVRDKDENPDSQAWPLDRWLVAFENRNGVELKYREQDTFGREVVQPQPGPFDSDQEAMDVLRRVCRKNGLTLVEVGPHIFRIRRLDGIR